MKNPVATTAMMRHPDSETENSMVIPIPPELQSDHLIRAEDGQGTSPADAGAPPTTSRSARNTITPGKTSSWSAQLRCHSTSQARFQKRIDRRQASAGWRPADAAKATGPFPNPACV
ncbi:hypothetical protein [Streptomyces hainanensis]|uniref:hypothetical protein n=1 Tax=Streptomyces hainanensis TaxID=402648 RepID=UPI00104875E6|nr:hypothetical protein [Streptomyces hainanensis]